MTIDMTKLKTNDYILYERAHNKNVYKVLSVVKYHGMKSLYRIELKNYGVLEIESDGIAYYNGNPKYNKFSEILEILWLRFLTLREATL